MLNIHTFILWLGVMAPLIFSPGPANLSVAGAASNSGFRSIIPFVAGISTVNITMLLIIGFSFSQLHSSAPLLFKSIEFLGAIYICYLSYFFLRAPTIKTIDDKNQNPLSFINGLMLQLLNGKFYPSAVMMFSIFLDNQSNLFQDTIIISLMLTVLAILSYSMWAIIGSAIKYGLNETTSIFIQRYVFGTLLLITGLWFLSESIIYWHKLLFNG